MKVVSYLRVPKEQRCEVTRSEVVSYLRVPKEQRCEVTRSEVVSYLRVPEPPPGRDCAVVGRAGDGCHKTGPPPPGCLYHTMCLKETAKLRQYAKHLNI